MKSLILILPVVLLAACASREPNQKPVSSAVVSGKPVVNPEVVRIPDMISEYRFGRYVDPSNRQLMHEAHPIYRIEKLAAWNLLAGGSYPTRPIHAAPGVTSAATKDGVAAEIGRQQLATKAVTRQAAELNQRLSTLVDSVTQTKQTAEQQLLQQRDIASLKMRLNAIETNRGQEPAKANNQTPAEPEEAW